MDYETQRMTGWGAADTFFQGAVDFEHISSDPGYAVHPLDRKRVRRIWAEQDARGEDRSAEYRLNRDDKLVWVLQSSRLTHGSGAAPRRTLGVMQNITARKVAELAAEEASAAKSQFLATMSHEIRTPLNGVLGMAQAMAAGDLGVEQRERLDIVRQSGETLLSILNDILDFSKIEAGKLELEVIPFDLAQVAQSAIAPFMPLAQSKGVTLTCDVEAARGVYRGDPTRLRQILYNLISNALKFTASGEVRLTGRRRGDVLELSVSDTGIGIPADKLGALFESFSQVDASTARRFGGTGLGLAICRRLTEMMGGRIDVESEHGRGSTFTALVPLPRIGDETPVALQQSGPAEAEGPGALKVLAAEDNEVNRLVLKTLLEQIGVSPHLVGNGWEAVTAWDSGEWDLI
ncbi:MAG: hybrid sensor histidine kinase/response regulator, partial [Caulobacteraceae bacterium]